jgi:hypothetical protein
MQAGLPHGAALPWRSDRGAAPPATLPVPGAGEAPWRATSMPLLRAGRPLKRWRYVGVYGPQLMLCVGDVHIGPARQTFWGVWDREHGRLHERTNLFAHRSVLLEHGRARVRDRARGVEIDLVLDEDDGVASICPDGPSGYVWTRKQGGVAARGQVSLPGAARRAVDARAVIDDTAGYHARETAWMWSAGVGDDASGARVAWNLVTGVNDPERGSERTLWVDGVPREVDRVRFGHELDGVEFSEGGALRFSAEATRSRRDNLLVIRSDYEQPFGTFSGVLPGGVELREGFGVMERHSARW